MTLNRELFKRDPLEFQIPNNGVAKVIEPRTTEEWNVLRYELSSFVCEGEYKDGLLRVLETFNSNLNRPEQPAVWVSGFYGSGKSHLVRVLEYLWRDIQFPDGVTARGLMSLNEDIKTSLIELTKNGKQAGGLWSAAGTLGAGVGKSIRLGLLGIIFKSAGLPEQYAPAQFVIWLKQNGYYEAVKSKVEGYGKEFPKELNNLWVSPILASSLLEVEPGFANDQIQAREFFKTKYSNPPDITDESLIQTMNDVLNLVTKKEGKIPLTLLVFDELQQFIGDDQDRALRVQDVVEACTSRFGSKILFVGTGQAALQATPQLQKLQGRFNVKITLSDKDVEQVVREVVLQKKEDKKGEIAIILEKSIGEIDRHLDTTKIGPKEKDKRELVSDYPLLPVRRRFWEDVLRAVDTAGTIAQLRTQLRIVHEATREVAKEKLGHVVAGDFIFDQLKAELLQGGVLLRDLDITINEQAKLEPDGHLRARICGLIFLIGKLPTEGPAAHNVRSTAAIIADLLVEDLTIPSTTLRQEVSLTLEKLVNEGILMQVEDEYRLQTRESTDWEQEFKNRYIQIKNDDSRIASERSSQIKIVVNESLKGISLVQGVSKTPRKFDPYYGNDTPVIAANAVPVWIRDEWSVSEKAIREEAQREGVESPIVFVSLPKLGSDALREALATQLAAQETIDMKRARTTSYEGQEACSAMEAKARIAQSKVRTLIDSIVKSARVFQGGGVEVNENNFKSSIQTSIQAALYHLFPEFDDVDQTTWGMVVRRAADGAVDPLSAIGYSGDTDQHKACKKVREIISNSGTMGGDIRKKFMSPPYGWSQDAVDGCVLALLAGGFIRAAKNGTPVKVKGFVQSQIGVTNFYNEGITISITHRLKIRKFLQSLGIPYKPNEEAEVISIALQKISNAANEAGGDNPLPPIPDKVFVDELIGLAGNEQFIRVFEKTDDLLSSLEKWTNIRNLKGERLPRWELFKRLLNFATSLSMYPELNNEYQAILNRRTLLENPDPIEPLLKQITKAFREELGKKRDQLIEGIKREVSNLEETSEWSQISDADRGRILTNFNLGKVKELRVGTDDELLSELESGSLSDWDNRLAALPGRAQQAREALIKLVSPKAVQIIPPHATIKTQAELDAYLDRLRADVTKHLNDGTPVIL
jgi:hypothetical protein